MLTVSDLHVRVGARLLLADVNFHVSLGDKIGLVGRNGAGKTTLTRILAGEGQPAEGSVTRVGSVGYLPQDPRTGDLSITAADRVLSARGLDAIVRAMRAAEAAMSAETAMSAATTATADATTSTEATTAGSAAVTTATAAGATAKAGTATAGAMESAYDADRATAAHNWPVKPYDRAVNAHNGPVKAYDRAVKAYDTAVKAYGRAEAEFIAAGGYAAEAEAAQVTASLGLPDRLLAQPLSTLSGGQRRRVELARVLFAGHDTLLLDEPTNHLDADSILWLRDFLNAYRGGLIVISHDVQLLDRTVNRVFHLDANRTSIDVYNVGWQAYLDQRDAEERRRRRERANAERKAGSLLAQADKMRASAGTASAAKNMARRAHRMLDGLEPERRNDRVAKIRLPDPAPSGKTPLTAAGLSKSYGSLEIFTGVDLAIDRGSRVVILGLNGAGKTTLLRILAGQERPDTGVVAPGHGLRLGYYAQEHETLETDKTVWQHMREAAPHLADSEARKVLGSFLFSGDDADKPAGVLSGGEKTRLALATLVSSSANVLLLDEPTNNLDPISRREILSAIQRYRGAIVMVTHDEGAVEALQPDRVLLLPDGVEDLWTEDYTDLVSLA